MSKQRKRTSVKQVQAEESKPFDLPKVTIKPEVDEDAWGKDGLTLKQRRFVKAYVGPAAGNATKAAEMAGYSDNNRAVLATTASENLRKPNVQRALGRALSRGAGSKRWTLRSIAELANVNIDNYLNEDGTLNLVRARAGGAMGAIKKLRIRDMGDAGKQIEVETYDRLAALQTLAKVHGTLIERVEHTGKDGGPIETRQVDYDAIEDELRSIGSSRLARRAAPNN